MKYRRVASVNDITADLRAASHTSTNDGGDIVSALARWSSPISVVTLIDAVLADDASVTRVAQDSYPHLLGFDKYVLWSMNRFEQLQLHVWWPGHRVGRNDVHNHRFSFASAVVAGSIRSRIYEIDPAGTPMTRLHETSENAGTWQYRSADPVRLRRVFDAELASATAYYQEAELLHEVDACADLTVTLVWQGLVRREYSTVCFESRQAPPVPSRREVFDIDEVTYRLTQLVTLLG